MSRMTPARRRWSTTTRIRVGMIVIWSEVIVTAITVEATGLDAAWWPPLVMIAVIAVTVAVAATMGRRTPRG